MKIVLVHHQDPANIHAFSGTSYFMSKAIREIFDVVAEYHCLELPDTFRQVYAQGIRKTLQPIGARLTSFLRSNKIEADFVICQGGNSSIPYYCYHIPVVFWHDSTWHTLLKGYGDPEVFRVFKSTCRNFYQWDKSALRKTDILLYSSQFVADACIREYGVPPEKTGVIPFGANIAASPSMRFLEDALQVRLASATLNLTFLGKDWERKGLPDAFLLAEQLNKLGRATTLNVIGCQPDIAHMKDAPFVRWLGFLDKSKKHDLEILEDVLRETHFMVHPARSEAFGIALCEANAYGVPVIGTPVEGLKTIVEHGLNGYLFDQEEWVAKATGLIESVMSDLEARYTPLFRAAHREYHRRLNWDVNVRELKKMLSSYRQAVPLRP